MRIYIIHSQKSILLCNLHVLIQRYKFKPSSCISKLYTQGQRLIGTALLSVFPTAPSQRGDVYSTNSAESDRSSAIRQETSGGPVYYHVPGGVPL